MLELARWGRWTDEASCGIVHPNAAAGDRAHVPRALASRASRPPIIAEGARLGLIVVHAGMPKAASSSIQTWLRLHQAQLRRDHSTTLLVASLADRASTDVTVAEATERSMLSNPLALAFRDPHSDQGALAEGFASGVDRHARRGRAVVLTTEAFTQILWQPNPAFLGALERLAQDHEVRVAYYVRPQDEALEAGWRQWGFRSGMLPSAFLESFLGRMDYLGTYRAVRERAPSAKFLMWPLRRELLLGGNVLVDFARRSLDLPEESVGDTSIWSNAGLPLEVVNELQGRKSPLWKSMHDNSVLTRLKPYVMSLKLKESSRARRSRRALRALAHQRFEPGNRELASMLAWGADHLIAAPELAEVPVLTEFDALWAARSAPAVRELLVQALAFVATHRK